jgi:hypothetical protein
MDFLFQPPLPGPVKPGETRFGLTVGDLVQICNGAFTGWRGRVRAFLESSVGVGLYENYPPDCAIWFRQEEVKKV